MKNKLFYEENSQCLNCRETKVELFRYVESKAGEEIVFENEDVVLLVFILSGKALISCNEFNNVLFQSNEMCLFPIAADCTWKTVEDATGIVLRASRSGDPCTREAMQSYSEHWLNAEPAFYGLTIRPALLHFLHSIKTYLTDGKTCPQMHYVKENELAILFRAYYSTEELIEFFMPTIKNRDGFQQFIMKNYLKMKGVQEFVDLSGLNLSTFNRKFKAQFGTTPYQWMMKQKSKHILHALVARDKSIAEIMREFDFSDASHFNRYCKTIFGASPTELRGQVKHKAS